MATLLEALLTKIPSDTEERVDRTKTRLNQAIREALRRETGIGLAQKDEETQESIGVRIHLVPGLPASLRHKEITEKDRLEGKKVRQKGVSPCQLTIGFIAMVGKEGHPHLNDNAALF